MVFDPKTTRVLYNLEAGKLLLTKNDKIFIENKDGMFVEQKTTYQFYGSWKFEEYSENIMPEYFSELYPGYEDDGYTRNLTYIVYQRNKKIVYSEYGRPEEFLKQLTEEKIWHLPDNLYTVTDYFKISNKTQLFVISKRFDKSAKLFFLVRCGMLVDITVKEKYDNSFNDFNAVVVEKESELIHQFAYRGLSNTRFDDKLVSRTSIKDEDICLPYVCTTGITQRFLFCHYYKKFKPG